MTVTELLLNGTVFVLIGSFAGLMAGILGIGGGVVVVPGLLFVFQFSHFIPPELSMHVAAGSSLAAMIVTSQASIRAHLKLGHVLWDIFHTLWPGILLGTIIGALIANSVPTHWLKIIFALFIFLVALKMLIDVNLPHATRAPPLWVNRLVSFVIGLKSGLLGVGGGILIVPYLTYCGIDARKITAVSNLCTFTVGLVGTLVFMMTGRAEMGSIPYSTGFVYWPAVVAVGIPSSLVAPFGARLSYRLPVKQLKYAFILILLITAINLLF